MVLDHIARIELSGEMERAYDDELQTLVFIRDGLEYLYHLVSGQEARLPPLIRGEGAASALPPEVQKLLEGKEWEIAFAWKNVPQLSGIPQGLVACAFDWYAISACNYVEIVGWLAQASGQSSLNQHKYLEEVIPDLLAWRDKVAAHRAKVRCRDNLAEKEASMLFPVGIIRGLFWASPWTVTTRQGRSTYSSGKIKQWSLTKTHEGLRERYWPQFHGVQGKAE